MYNPMGKFYEGDAPAQVTAKNIVSNLGFANNDLKSVVNGHVSNFSQLKQVFPQVKESVRDANLLYSWMGETSKHDYNPIGFYAKETASAITSLESELNSITGPTLSSEQEQKIIEKVNEVSKFYQLAANFVGINQQTNA